MSTIRQVPLISCSHSRPVTHLEFSDVTIYGYFLISAGKDGMPMLHQGETSDWIGTFEGHRGAVWGAALTHNANIAATAAADFTAKLWDAERGNLIHSFDHGHVVRSVNFNCDESLLVTASHDKVIRVFDLNRPEMGPMETINAHTKIIRNAIFLHNRRIVSISDDQTMRVWDRTSGQEVLKIEFASAPKGLELSRDREILTVAHGRNVSFYSSDTMHTLREYPVPTICNSASLSPSRESFIFGGEDLKVYKFDYNTGDELESNKGHFGAIHCVRWSPDGEVYGSASEDGTMRLWQDVPGRVYGLWRCVTGNRAEARRFYVSAELHPPWSRTDWSAAASSFPSTTVQSVRDHGGCNSAET